MIIIIRKKKLGEKRKKTNEKGQESFKLYLERKKIFGKVHSNPL